MNALPLYRERPVVHLTTKRDVRRALHRGTPWLMRDTVEALAPDVLGAFALLKDPSGNILAKGIADGTTPLAFRVLATGSAPFTAAHIKERLTRALCLRRKLFDTSTTAYRLCNGEGDFLPGLVIDRYGSTAVIKCDGASPSRFWDTANIGQTLLALDATLSTVYQKTDGGLTLLAATGRGDIDPCHVTVTEHGLRFIVNLQLGQKTGLFLDQRDNRQRVKALSSGKRVLNLCGYTGGFAIAAAAGGAKSATSVDISAPATEAAVRNWQANNLTNESLQAVTADVFQFLADSQNNRHNWEVVIADPPAFVHNTSQLRRGVDAYLRLFANSISVVTSPGILVAASCSRPIDRARFRSILDEALYRARRRARLLGDYGLPLNHPTPLYGGSLEYLKCVFLEIE